MPKQLALSILLLSILIIMLSISFECTMYNNTGEKKWHRNRIDEGSFAIYHWPNKIRIWPHRISDNTFHHSIYIPDQLPRHIVDVFSFNFAFVTIDTELNDMHREQKAFARKSSIWKIYSNKCRPWASGSPNVLESCYHFCYKTAPDWELNKSPAQPKHQVELAVLESSNDKRTQKNPHWLIWYK